MDLEVVRMDEEIELLLGVRDLQCQRYQATLLSILPFQ